MLSKNHCSYGIEQMGDLFIVCLVEYFNAGKFWKVINSSFYRKNIQIMVIMEMVMLSVA